MSTWANPKSVITTAGLALQAKLLAGTTLTITKAVAGLGTVDESDLASQTAVTNPISTPLSLQGASIDEGAAKCKLPVVLTNENISSACVITQIGVFANDPDNGEILFFISQSATGLDVPTATDSPGYSSRWNFVFGYGQADNVTVTVDPSSSVSYSDMATYVSNAIEVKADLSALNEHINSKNNPHNVTKTQIGLGNVDNTSDAEKPVSTATQAALNQKAAADLSNVSYDSFLALAKASGAGGIPIVSLTGDGTAYTGTADGVTELGTGMIIIAIPDTTSSANTPTLNLNSLGVKNIKQRLSINTSLTVPAANATWMVANKPVLLMYDGNQWVTIHARTSADDIYGSVAKSLTATLTTTWTEQSDGTFAQSVSVDEVTADDKQAITVDCDLDGTDIDADIAVLEAWGCVNRCDQGDGKLTFVCYGDKPTVAIPLNVVVM